MKLSLIFGFTLLVLVFNITAPLGELSDDSHLATSATHYLDLVDIIEGSSCGPLVIDGNVVYAIFDALLCIFDVSDPAHPVRLSYLALEATINDITLHGNLAYLLATDQSGGEHEGTIWIVDITDPASPVIVGENNDCTSGYRLTVSGNHLYVAMGWDGFRVLDITNPLVPTGVGSYATGSGAIDVAVVGTRAYIAEYSSGLSIIDVSNPAIPTLDTLMTFTNGAKTVDVNSGVAIVTNYIGGSPQTRFIDISDPENPFEAATLPGEDSDVAISGSYAYLPDYYGTFRIVDVSSPSSPSVVGTEILDEGDRVSVSGSYAAVSKGYYGWGIVDISTPASPSELGSLEPLSNMERISSAGNYLPIYDTNGMMMMVEKDDPYGGRYPLGVYHYAVDGVDGLEIRGNYLYAGLNDSWYQYGSGVQIVDISNPAIPVEAEFYSVNNWVWGLDVDGTKTYYAEYRDLVCLDTTDPLNPSELGRITVDRAIYDLAVSGSYAYIAEGDSGLTVVDVSNPASMTFLAHQVTTADRAIIYDVALGTHHAYLVGYGYGDPGGLWVFDISDPNNPVEVAMFDSGGRAQGVVIDLPYLHLTQTGDNRYRILDVTDPTNPVVAAYNDAGGIKGPVVLDPPYVWAISSLHGGLLKFQTDALSAAEEMPEHTPHYTNQLEQNYPNPFNPSTVIRYHVADPGRVSIRVYDVRGTLVNVLYEGIRSKGQFDAGWNGENLRGENVASGIYFYRMVTPKFSQTRKMVLLK